MANKIAMLLSEAMNNNVVINTCLRVSFAVFGLRSDKQQKYVLALAEQKDSLVKSNKAMKVTMWEWKQLLLLVIARSFIFPRLRPSMVKSPQPLNQVTQPRKSLKCLPPRS